jgi:Fe-S cluster assembly iron-binding protein IscA
LLACAAVAGGGCSRAKYRLQADRDAYELIVNTHGFERSFE